MQIRQANDNSTHTRPAFGWQVLCRGNVLNGARQIPVEFCLLKAEDTPFIRTIEYRWRRNTLVGKYIVSSFLRSTAAPMPLNRDKLLFNHFMLKPATDCKEHLGAPLAMGTLIRKGDSYELQYLQTSDQILQEIKLPRIKGSGSMILYGIAKFLNSINAQGLKINSINGPFYRKVFPSIEHKKSEFFRIDMKAITDFIEATQQKYGLQSEPKNFTQEQISQINKNTFKEAANRIIL